MGFELMYETEYSSTAYAVHWATRMMCSMAKFAYSCYFSLNSDNSIQQNISRITPLNIKIFCQLLAIKKNFRQIAIDFTLFFVELQS